jgi:hypothetical protein
MFRPLSRRSPFSRSAAVIASGLASVLALAVALPAPDLERFMAERAGSHTVEVRSSHVPMVSQPDAVTRLIERADRGTR